MIFHLYGFFIALGILAGLLVVDKIADVQNFVNKDKDGKGLEVDVFSILPWILIPGIIGARFYHVVDYWSYYDKNLIEIFYLWQGGLGIFGGIIGGVSGLFIYSAFISLKQFRKDIKILEIKKLMEISPQYFNILISNFFSLLDLGAIGLPLGQAIGRWGNYFNQELYGLPTSLPWGIYIRPENRLPGFENFERFHPLFLYESLGCLLIFLIIFGIANFSSRSHGKLFFLYLFLYSFLRFWLEFLRIEGWRIKGIRVNQFVCLSLMMIPTLSFFKRR